MVGYLKNWAFFFMIFGILWVILNYVIGNILQNKLLGSESFLFRVVYGAAVQFIGAILSFVVAAGINKRFLQEICHLKRKKFILLMAWAYAISYLPSLMLLAFGLTYLAARLFPGQRDWNLPGILGVFAILPSSLMVFGVFYIINWFWFRHKLRQTNLAA